MGAGNRWIGHYEVLRELGRGGMGVVYLAQDSRTGRRVALKLLLGLGGRSVERFHTEAQAVARLRHPGIVTVHELGEDKGRPFLVLDFVEGTSLADRVRQGPQPPREAVELIAALAEAVEYAHSQSVLHRDIKPANVLITRDGRPVLADFGLAKDLESTREHLTRTGQVLGTPAYAPPEQIDGERERIGPRSDVYSLGATLYSLLAGQAPFTGGSTMNLIHNVVATPALPPSKSSPQVSPELDGIVLRCLEKHPGGRYPSARALREDLLRFLHDEQVEGLGRSGYSSSGLRWAIAGLLAVAAGVVAVIALSLPTDAPVVDVAPSTSGVVAPEGPDPEEALRDALKQETPQLAQRALRAWLSDHAGHAKEGETRAELLSLLREHPYAVLPYPKKGAAQGWFTGPTTVVVVGVGREVLTFDVESGEEVARVVLPADPTSGPYFASARVEGGVAVSSRGSVLWALGNRSDSTVVSDGLIVSLAASPDGRQLAVSTSTGKLLLVDVRTFDVKTLREEGDMIVGVCFLPSNRLWAFSTLGSRGIESGRAYLYDFDGQRIGGGWHTDVVLAAVHLPATDTLLVGNSYGAILRRDFEGQRSGSLVAPGEEGFRRAHHGPLRSLWLSKGKDVLFSLGAGKEPEKNEVISWDPISGTMLHRLKRSTHLERLALGPDGRYLAIGFKLGRVEVWSTDAFVPLTAPTVSAKT